MMELTQDLQNFLVNCESEFAARYTDEDVDYKKHCEESHQKVPIEERWFVRPSRPQYDNRGDRGGHRRHWEHRDHHNDGRGYRDNRGWRQRDRYNDRNHPYSRNSDRNQHYSRNDRY